MWTQLSNCENCNILENKNDDSIFRYTVILLTLYNLPSEIGRCSSCPTQSAQALYPWRRGPKVGELECVGQKP